jgi:hypothetical protein
MVMMGEFRCRLLALAMLSLPPLLLAGCAGTPEQPQAAAPEPMRILDPVAAFAADPPTYGEAVVELSDSGATARLRIIRQYTAASGRECREVRVAQRSGDQTRLFCRAGTGWIEARPLLSQALAPQ